MRFREKKSFLEKVKNRVEDKRQETIVATLFRHSQRSRDYQDQKHQMKKKNNFIRSGFFWLPCWESCPLPGLTWLPAVPTFLWGTLLSTIWGYLRLFIW